MVNRPAITSSNVELSGRENPPSSALPAAPKNPIIMMTWTTKPPTALTATEAPLSAGPTPTRSRKRVVSANPPAPPGPTRPANEEAT